VVRQIEIEAGQLLDVGDVTLVVLRGQVRVLAGPIVPERVLLRDETGSRELKLPATFGVDARQYRCIVASKPGYRNYEQVVSFADGKREQIYTVQLERPKARYRFPQLDVGHIQATVARYTGSLKRRCQPRLTDRALNPASSSR
jgi:hypothetical protein